MPRLGPQSGRVCIRVGHTKGDRAYEWGWTYREEWDIQIGTGHTKGDWTYKRVRRTERDCTYKEELYVQHRIDIERDKEIDIERF